jgi:hypothetical protein
MDISFESNIRQWSAAMTSFEREQVPFATALALTNTAKDMRTYHQSLMPVIFDRPTRFTVNSLYYLSARKSDAVATAGIYFKDSSRFRRHYLMPQVEGGSRPIKRFERWLIGRRIMRAGEFAVPAKGLKLDAYGNVPNGIITQILSQLQASPDAHQWETERSRKRAGKKRARYFVPQRGLPRGIYRRSGNVVEPVFVFVGGVNYKVRYRFYDLSRDYAAQHFPKNFADAMERAWRTSNGPVR